MTITGIVLNLMYCSGSGFDRRTEAAIPLSGEDLVITEIKRQEYETKVRKYKLSPETVAEFTALIDKYGITGWFITSTITTPHLRLPLNRLLPK